MRWRFSLAPEREECNNCSNPQTLRNGDPKSTQYCKVITRAQIQEACHAPKRAELDPGSSFALEVHPALLKVSANRAAAVATEATVAATRVRKR
eukprot:CAMPEP_0180443196 /NCGR_PEP_ID=MMETSP1036_2-20121128/14544_1 /TAXON_ID=632150 /ORGANISM="Azadinium spinosum, Strain 3D9" /LENGTH=93 /DNA_ID=CAMNT_0022449489 /DNA_START=82 /DNA_END=360 /DNA_ORIENTATION=+